MMEYEAQQTAAWSNSLLMTILWCIPTGTCKTHMINELLKIPI